MNHRRRAAPTTNAAPPTAMSDGALRSLPSAINVTPAFIATNCAHTHAPGGGPVAVNAAPNVCMAPAIATDAAPATRRCNGNQIPSRTLHGSRSESPASVNHPRAAV